MCMCIRVVGGGWGGVDQRRGEGGSECREFRELNLFSFFQSLWIGISGVQFRCKF